MNKNLSNKDLLKIFGDSLNFSEGELELVKNAMIADQKKNINIFLQERFQENIEFFKTYQKDIYDKFINYKFQRDISFVETDDGLFDLYIKDDNYYLYNLEPQKVNANLCEEHIRDSKHILRQPYVHEKDWFGQIHYRYLNESVDLYEKEGPYDVETISDINALPCLLFIGSGLGYIIEEFYKKVDIKKAIVVEPNYDLFFASLHVFDYKSLLSFLQANKQSITFFIENKADGFISFLNMFFYEQGRYLNKCMSIYIHYRSEEINYFITELNNHFSSVNRGFGFYDDSLFGLSHGIHNTLNKKYFIKGDIYISNKYKNMPIFIIGNGPSLDNDIDFIRKNQDKALIVACGTTLDTLYNQGIQADIFIATERVYDMVNIFNHLDKNYIKNVLLVSSEVVHPDVSKHFKNTCLFLKTEETFHLLRFIDPKLKSFIEELRFIYLMNPHVSNLAVSFALNVGFKHIYLFGIDNGTKNVNKMHADSSFLYKECNYSSEGINFEKDEVVAANFGDGSVISNQIFKVSISNLNSIVRAYKDNELRIFNCSDGALIDAIEAKRHKDINLSKIANINKEKFLEYFMSTFTITPSFNKEDFVNILHNEIFEMIIDKVIDLLNIPLSSREDGFNRIDFISSFFKKETDMDAFYKTIIAGSVEAFLVMLNLSLYKYKDESRAINLYEKIKERFIYFLLDAKVLFKYLPDYIMENHKVLLNGKVGFEHKDSKPIDIISYTSIKNKEALSKVKDFVKRYD